LSSIYTIDENEQSGVADRRDTDDWLRAMFNGRHQKVSFRK